jgi:uncharacterized membrane protein YgcG
VLLIAAPAGLAAEDFGQPEAGRYVYDRAGLLNADEVRDLERRAAAVAQAGAPPIVYLRSQDADEDETIKDAQELMDAWDVQSANGARDGVVIFLNLDPDNPRRGRAAIWAGQRHAEGNLPEYELRRIYDDVMQPLLADDQTAAGIGAGLDQLANSLAVGPPPPPQPSAFQRAASTVAGLPLAIVALIASAGLAFLGGRLWSARPLPVGAGGATTQRPDDLPPAIAGALVKRRIEPHALVEATLLDFARRGGVVMEPRGQKALAVRLSDERVVRSPYERIVWDILANSADRDGLITEKDLKALRKVDKPFAEALREELESNGWYSRDVRARQTPLYLGGMVALILAAVAFILTVAGQQPWGLFGIVLLVAAGIALLCLGAVYPRTTADGESIAAPWHAYYAGLKAAAKERQTLDLDLVLPDVVAFGLISVLDKVLKEASEAGYAPSWFVQGTGHQPTMVAFYPYWSIFHGSTSPTSSPSSGSASSGGAVPAFRQAHQTRNGDPVRYVCADPIGLSG